MKFFRYIAPAGTHITYREMFQWLYDLIILRDNRERLIFAIKTKYNIRHCYLLSSGRAAMAIILEILKRCNTDINRTEILVPGYTCYSVPAAAEIAGLNIRICDIDPETLSYNKEQILSVDFKKVLCIVTSSLYGFPNDLAFIERIARENGCYMLDDAAQSMNSKQSNRYAGTFGDVGLFSLDKGKNITSLQGGIVVTNNDMLAKEIRYEVDKLPTPGLAKVITEAAKLLIYITMLRPALYWLPANMKILGLGKTIYTTDYYYSKYSYHLSTISTALFDRIDPITQNRTLIYNKVRHALNNCKYIKFIEPVAHDTTPAYLRIALYINNHHIRSRIVNELNQSGIGATMSYAKSLTKLDNIKHFSVIHNDVALGSLYTADHIITLPTISFMTDHDVTTICKIIEKYTSSSNYPID